MKEGEQLDPELMKPEDFESNENGEDNEADGMEKEES